MVKKLQVYLICWSASLSEQLISSILVVSNELDKRNTKKSNYMDIVSKHDIGMYVLIPISILLDKLIPRVAFQIFHF